MQHEETAGYSVGYCRASETCGVVAGSGNEWCF